MVTPDLSMSLDQGGLVLLGCGKMGTALLRGWIAGGLPSERIWVLEPKPGPDLQNLAEKGLRLNEALPDQPKACLLAVKPQILLEALARVAQFGGGKTLFISIAAGIKLEALGQSLGQETPVIRAMPNTPVTIGMGITALIGNGACSEADMALANALMSAVGKSVSLENEEQIDTVTALSGSGPAYVFYLIETMTAAGIDLGLPKKMAEKLAVETVAGAGALAASAGEAPEILRANVTSPGGTTAAALDQLMDPEAGLPPLVVRAISAAMARSKELSQT